MTPPPPPPLQSPQSSWPSPYPYKGLTGSQIRVIRIVPSNDGKSNCCLQHVALDEAPHYHALSYVWGNPKVKELISLDGHDFFVTANLYSALGKLQSIPPRDGHSFNLFWIDAICVNQADTEEKNVQVPRMDAIYMEADLVFIWLSIVSTKEGSDLLATTLHKAVRPEEANQAVQQVLTLYRQQKAHSHDMSKLQHAVFCLGTIHPWFRRIWTLQEAVLATKSPVFLFTDTGKGETITLDSLASYSYKDSNGEAWNGLTAMRAWVKDPQRAAASVAGNAGWMLIQLLSFIQSKDATVFHDHLYGVYGILETFKGHFPQLRLPEVNYSRPAAHIFAELTKFIIESTGNTAILDSVLARSRVPGAPTWVCGFHNVWTPAYSPPLYDPADKPVVSADGLRLSITGHIAAAVWIVFPEFKNRDKRGASTFLDFLPQIERQVLAPVANRFNLEMKVVRRRLCRNDDALLAYYESLRLGQTDLSADQGSPLHSLFLITLGSCIFATDRGYIGICHIDMATEVGDYLCYRKGADQPIIVRQVSGADKTSGTYQVIGPPAWFGEDPVDSKLHRVTLE